MWSPIALLLGIGLVTPAAPFAPQGHRSTLTTSPSPTAAAATATRLRLSKSEEAAATPPSRPPRVGRRSSSSSSERPRRPPPNRNRSSSASTERRRREQKRERAPHQFDHTKADARPFLDVDPAAFVRDQGTNENAPCYVFPGDDDDEADEADGVEIPEDSHIASVGLDDLFPGLDFSEKFCGDGEFRDALRAAMREDVFDTTETYAGMSEKARRMLLLPDSSLQGSWNCRRRQPIFGDDDDNDDDVGEEENLRMQRSTQVLRRYLGKGAPTGDEFMETIGGLCGPGPSAHWIDIVGITDRRISHSWHQDHAMGGDDSSRRTVLLGFPREDDYDGAGVFSHALKLRYERRAPKDHPGNEPVVYPGLEVDDEFVVRPRFARGSEIIAFRDIDTLHSAPDVAYRASVMRFM